MKLSVLIPDGESHLLIYVINSLSQIKGIKIYIMSNVKYMSMRSSRYIHHYSYFPKSEHELDWIANINSEIKKHNIDIVMPIFEKGIETAIRYKTEIEGNKLVILPTLENFEKARNKWLLTRHLSTLGIPFPKSILFSENLSSELEKLRFPIILKPTLVSGGGDGVKLFKIKEDLNDHLSNTKVGYEQMIQEYVTGYDIGCSVLCKSGEILAYTIQKATMLNTNPFKPLLGVQFVYEEELYQQIAQLMKSLNWSGVAHIDLRFDAEDSTFKIIEVNPRFWGSLDASLMSGINFPYLYCKTTLNEKFDIPKYSYINYLNMKGIGKQIFKDKSTIFNLNFIMKNTPVGLALKDPLPTILKYMNFSRKILMNKLKFK